MPFHFLFISLKSRLTFFTFHTFHMDHFFEDCGHDIDKHILTVFTFMSFKLFLKDWLADLFCSIKLIEIAFVNGILIQYVWILQNYPYSEILF